MRLYTVLEQEVGGVSPFGVIASDQSYMRALDIAMEFRDQHPDRHYYVVWVCDYVRLPAVQRYPDGSPKCTCEAYAEGLVDDNCPFHRDPEVASA